MDARLDPLAWLAAQARAGVPGRWQTLEALARRAAAQPPGALRDALVERLQARARRLPAADAPTTPLATGPGLAELLERIDPERRELRAATLDARAWTRLRVERRLAEPLATPAAAPAERLGPLHTQVLLPRALQLLRELSPDYLQRLLASVDELAALTAAPPEPEAPPPRRTRKAR